jgi:hypothetical protein
VSITMIRGYGLPSDAASSYNGYGAVPSGGPVRGAVVNVPSVALPTGRWQNPYPPVSSYAAQLFRTTPDPQLGGFGDFGFTMPGAVSGGMKTLPTSSADLGNGGGGVGGLDMTTIAIGLGVVGLGLYFLTKKR